MSGIEVGKCWQCGHPVLDTETGREAECSQCGKQLHVCRNCRFYQPGLANDCSEPMAERVQDKIRANFCDYFTPHAGAYQGNDPTDQDALRQAAEDLFNK